MKIRSRERDSLANSLSLCFKWRSISKNAVRALAIYATQFASDGAPPLLLRESARRQKGLSDICMTVAASYWLSVLKSSYITF